MAASNPTLDRMFRKAGLSVVQQFKERLAARRLQEQGAVAADGGVLDCPDPVRFFREWLGIEPWLRQQEMLRAVVEHDSVIVRSGHKVSKLLALDTPVPTPTGWVTIGGLRAGDLVLDDAGAPCRVRGTSPIKYGSECFEVVFDDGAVVCADGTHLWRSEHGEGSGSLTTSEIRATLGLRHSMRGPRGVRYVVDVRPVASVPVRCIEVDSPSHLFLCSRSFIPTHNSNSLAGLALWWVKTQPAGRCVFTAPTGRQVEEVVFREVQILYRRAAEEKHVCRECSGRYIASELGSHARFCDGETDRLAPRPLGGQLYRKPDGGLRFQDGRQILGFSTDQPDKFNGISGNVLFLVDEGSGVSDTIYEAIEGNRAGGGDIFGGTKGGAKKAGGNKLVVTGNPTRTAGKFFRAFRDPKEREQWHRIHISSEEAAEYQRQTGQKVGYIATLEWVNQKRAQWGTESPLYYVRVKGDFAPHAESQLISLVSVEQAHERWGQLVAVLQRFSDVPLGDGGDVTVNAYRAFEKARRRVLFDHFAELSEEEQKLVETLRQPLRLGVDVAWFGTDFTAICPRRGDFIFPIMVLSTMDGPTVAFKVHEVVQALRDDPSALPDDPWRTGPAPERERPIVQFDAIGNGASAYDAAKHQYGEEFKAVPINVAEKSTDDESERLRDQVWCAARDFLKDGGMLPPDEILEAELLAPEYGPSSRGRLKVDDKDAMKAKLPEGRSPDRADALCLAVYQAKVFVGGASTPAFDRYG